MLVCKVSHFIVAKIKIKSKILQKCMHFNAYCIKVERIYFFIAMYTKGIYLAVL